MAATLSPVSHTFEHDGLMLHYVEYAPPDPAARALVMLHGLTSASGAWSRVAERLATGYHVYALDQRGHGESDWAPSDRYRTADYLADLEALVEHLGLERFVLIGQSMGGHNTLAYAARHPERLLAAVVNDIPAYVQRRTTAEQYEAQFPDGQHRTFATVDDWLAERRSEFTPEWAYQLQAEASLRAVEGGYQPRHDPQASIRWQPDDLREEARSIEVPLLIIRGGRSEVLTAADLQEMVMTIPGARSVTLEKAGHSTYHDMFDEWVEVATQFLSAHVRRDGVSAGPV